MNFWKLFNIQPTVQNSLDDQEIAEAEREQIEEDCRLSPKQNDRPEEVKKQFKAFVEGGPLETTSLISH